jgi:3-hydroxybutyryl-CoA dehydrogenase
MSEINRVAVLGAGTMGAGIAEVAAKAGMEVRLRDVADAPIEKGLATIRSSLEKAVSKGKLSDEARAAAIARIRTTTALAEAVADADLVIEAIPERMDWKKETLAAVEAAAPAHAVLATNTSSLSISEIASAAKDPSRVIGMHFFNPAPVMELCEIVRAAQTSDATLEVARAAAARFGKTAIVVRDSPGFATSRLGVCLAAEAIRMLEAGVASAEDIDRAMELGYRHPMGPLRLTDLVGLDVRLAILEHLFREVGEPFRPPPLLQALVREGKLGKKTGQGFYRWT